MVSSAVSSVCTRITMLAHSTTRDGTLLSTTRLRAAPATPKADSNVSLDGVLLQPAGHQRTGAQRAHSQLNQETILVAQSTMILSPRPHLCSHSQALTYTGRRLGASCVELRSPRAKALRVRSCLSRLRSPALLSDNLTRMRCAQCHSQRIVPAR